MAYKLDASGKICDDDKIFKTLDEYYNKEDYRAIVKAVTAVPPEMHSVKLRFGLIGAYNGLKQFDKSHDELDLIEPLCDTDELKALLCYTRGCTYYADGKAMKAVSCFTNGKKSDPKNKGGYKWDKLTAECRESTAEELEELRRLAVRIDKEISAAFSQKPGSGAEISEEEFAMYLGYLPAVRKVPGVSKGLLFDKENYFMKYKGTDKKSVLDFFENMYGVRSHESFRDMFTRYTGCNIMNFYTDIPPYLAGKLNFDVDELNDEGREAFFNAVEFFKPFNEFLPRAGVLAWDICEKVGLARLAFSCDIIGNVDFCTIMLMLTDKARENFSSFEEYTRSLIFGCGVYMFHTDQWNIDGAMEFIKMIMPMLLDGDLPRIKWRRKDGR